VKIWCLGASILYEPASIIWWILKRAREDDHELGFHVYAVEADEKLLKRGICDLGDEIDHGILQGFTKKRIAGHMTIIHDNFIYPQRDHLLIKRIQDGDIIIINNVFSQWIHKAQKKLIEHLLGIKTGSRIVLYDEEYGKLEELFRYHNIDIKEYFDIAPWTWAEIVPWDQTESFKRLIQKEGVSFCLTRKSTDLRGEQGDTIAGNADEPKAPFVAHSLLRPVRECEIVCE